MDPDTVMQQAYHQQTGFGQAQSAPPAAPDMMALLQRLTNITEQLAVNQQNQQQLAQAQAQAQAQQSGTSTSTKRTKLPDPERFNGKPSEYKSWEATIKAKLLDEQWIGEKAVIYAFERLEKPQQNQVLYLIESGCSDVMELFNHFQRITRNPREHQDAAVKLGKIQQKADEYLSSYISRFERLEREVTGYPDTTTSSLRIILFHRGLRQKLRESLEEFESELFKLSYADYVTKVQQHDRGHAKEARATPATSNQQPYIKREIAAIDSISRRSSSASEDRRANGSCFYCGSNEHWIANCTKKHRADAANQISQSNHSILSTSRFSNQSPIAPIAAATAVPTSSAAPTASIQTRSRSASPAAPTTSSPTTILQRPRLASTSSSISSSSICSGLSRFSKDEYCTHNVNIKYETCNTCVDYDEGFD
jgi:hypothetical protein